LKCVTSDGKRAQKKNLKPPGESQNANVKSLTMAVIVNVEIVSCFKNLTATGYEPCWPDKTLEVLETAVGCRRLELAQAKHRQQQWKIRGSESLLHTTHATT
jgi:hypothetical protein